MKPVRDSRRAPRSATRPFVLILALVAISLACADIAPPTPTDIVGTTNLCERDADCLAGTCVRPLGICAVEETTIGALLVEITPPATEKGFGGFRLLSKLEPSAARTQGPPALVVSEPPQLRGDIRLSFADPNCRPSPVEVTFTPVETYLGIETLRYSTLSQVGTEIVDQKHRDTHRYSLGGLPDGDYDIYVEDAGQVDNSGNPGCAVAPQIFRSQAVNSEGLSRLRLNLVQPQVRSLRVLVPWPSQLEGWEVDVVHPVTGERLSSRAVLSADRLEQSAQGEQFAVADLRVSEVRGADFIGPNQEQLRLRNPADPSQPTILMMLSGLEVYQRGEALVPRLQALASQVDYELWVWTSPNGGAVDGRVSFSAIQLDEIPAGVVGRLQTSVEIGSQGLVNVSLPPGKYQVRVSPSLSSARSSVTTVVTVWPPLTNDQGSSQGGQVLVVPNTATLDGQVVFHRRPPPNGTSVRLLGNLETVRPTVAERPFIPRSANTLVRDRYFALDGADCGSCDGEVGSSYSLIVAPPQHSGIPWWVASAVTIARAEVELQPIELGAPFVQSGSLQFKVGEDSFAFPRAMLRAFALLDQHGRPASSSTLPLCARLPPDVEAVDCLSRAVEVAATRSGQEGVFHLLLPQRLASVEIVEAPDAGAN